MLETWVLLVVTGSCLFAVRLLPWKLFRNPFGPSSGTSASGEVQMNDAALHLHIMSHLCRADGAPLTVRELATEIFHTGVLRKHNNRVEDMLCRLEKKGLCQRRLDSSHETIGWVIMPRFPVPTTGQMDELERNYSSRS
jgi:hypothetical protein